MLVFETPVGAASATASHSGMDGAVKSRSEADSEKCKKSLHGKVLCAASESFF